MIVAPKPPVPALVPPFGVHTPEWITLAWEGEDWAARDRRGRVSDRFAGTPAGLWVQWTLALYPPHRWIARVVGGAGSFYDTRVPDIPVHGLAVFPELPDAVLWEARTHDQAGAFTQPGLARDVVPLRLRLIRAMVADIAKLPTKDLAEILTSLPEEDADLFVGLIARLPR